MSKLPYEWADEVADYLVGTCVDTLETACEKFSVPPEVMKSVQFIDRIDERIFCCEDCGWWCSSDEESEEKPGVCDECDEDE